MMALLEIRDLLRELRSHPGCPRVNMDVEEGSMVACSAQNGSKTHDAQDDKRRYKGPASGSVRFGGSEIGAEGASRVARLGINMSPEGRLIFNELSVEENLTRRRLLHTQQGRDGGGT